MPIFEYHCNTCGKTFEKLVPWYNTDPHPACPSCQSKDTDKRISAPASFSIPGSGLASSAVSCGGTSSRFT